MSIARQRQGECEEEIYCHSHGAYGGIDQAIAFKTTTSSWSDDEANKGRNIVYPKLYFSKTCGHPFSTVPKNGLKFFSSSC